MRRMLRKLLGAHHESIEEEKSHAWRDAEGQALITDDELKAIAERVGLRHRRSIRYHFFAHNILCRSTSGDEAASDFEVFLEREAQDNRVAEFLLRFEKQLVQNFPLELSLYKICVLKRN